MKRNQASYNFLTNLTCKQIDIKMMNAEIMECVLLSFDCFTLLIRKEGQLVLVNKHAISSIVEAST